MSANTLDHKLLYQIALTKVSGVGDIVGKNLLTVVGDPQAVFESSKDALSAIKGLPQKVVKEIHNPQVMKDAERELEYIRKNNIKTYFTGEAGYPHRLLDCVDSPMLLYFRGDADFNRQKVISIVGTRNSTHYGNSFCETMIRELAKSFPDLLIVSGLAYGIDIVAHRAALTNGLSTIGVMAHGLDRVYPTVHRQTAMEMMEHGGGLLTEFASGTEPDRFNFVRRNRIVAGMADAVLVIESSAKGGSLITAELASSYCKDVFALPGKVTDVRSEGCNSLISKQKAEMLISAEHFISQMNWDQAAKPHKAPKQQQLFFDLTPQETTIISKLGEGGAMHIDQLSKCLDISAFDLFSILVELEMKGAVKGLAGGFYEAD